MILSTFNLGSCRPLDPAAPVVERRVQGEVVPALALEQGIKRCRRVGQAEIMIRNEKDIGRGRP